MAMRLDIDFPRPLDKAGRVAVLLALAGLAKSQGVRFTRGDHGAVVLGEGLSVRRVREVLAEQGVVVEDVRSSLDQEEDARSDDLLADPAQPERVRAIGR
jgi:hypothetical protein